MMSFRGGRFENMPLRQSTLWLVGDVMEAKGRQDLYVRQSPQLLKALREIALIQSAESSNRIEGVTVARERLAPLVIGAAWPRDRSEEEVQGYRNALNLIHTKAPSLEISPDLVRELHGVIQKGAGDAGQWKRVDNQIIETRRGQRPLVRFQPVSAALTPAAMQELCLSYRHTLDQRRAHPLVAVAALVLDFLCIHPFRDGNGRVGRLLFLLACYRQGLEVGRYISLERLVEESREDYYEDLRLSSQHWHEGRHDLLPWLNYVLAILRRAYFEFEQRAGQVKSQRGAKTELIESAVRSQVGPFSLSAIQGLCPGVSRDMVRRVLREMQSARKVECLSRGRSATWRKKEVMTLKSGTKWGNIT
jgi:Fic family protein